MRFTTPLDLQVYLCCVFVLASFSEYWRPTNAFSNGPKTRISKRRNPSSLEASENEVWDVLNDAEVLDPTSGRRSGALDGIKRKQNGEFFESISAMINGKPKQDFALVVVMPQLGDFDSAEYAELLASVEEELEQSKISLRIIGIGNEKSAKRFADFAGLNIDSIRVDPEGRLHRSLNLKRGPNWDVPQFIPEFFLDWFSDYVGVKNDDAARDSKAIFRSWLNYMAMCAGISSPDTLPEIFRGYVGDKRAPERLRSDEVVTVGKEHDEPFIAITGTTDVKLGPFNYKQAWKEESGYQRPLELATVRLRIMVEVLSNFAEYVPDQRYLDFRGATYLFKLSQGDGDPSLVYEHIDSGVLSYSKTMGRPLSFLEPYIGTKALNPLDLGDDSGSDAKM